MAAAHPMRIPAPAPAESPDEVADALDGVVDVGEVSLVVRVGDVELAELEFVVRVANISRLRTDQVRTVAALKLEAGSSTFPVFGSMKYDGPTLSGSQVPTLSRTQVLFPQGVR